ncbi:MAG: DNA polymerase [Porticoccaceae bacterium]
MPMPHFGSLQASATAQDFCAVAEARLMTNGLDVAELDYELKKIQYLEGQIPQNHGQCTWARKALFHRIKNGSCVDKHAATRLRYVELCQSRFDRGIPFNIAAVQDARLALEQRIRISRQDLPPGLIDNRGAVNLQRLSEVIPPALRSAWPTDAYGDLLTSKEALQQLDNKWAELLLTAKACHRDQILRNFRIDEDGRHRSWANPFGTKTGRDKPVGASFLYLPKAYRNLIQPDADSVVAYIDYEQQEPLIAAVFAGHERLLSLYAQGDLYAALADDGAWSTLSRKQFKRLFISYLYGRSPAAFCGAYGIDSATAQAWGQALDELLRPIEEWMKAKTAQAFSDGIIRSLDWHIWVQPDMSPLSLRNWPIQAAGADILRRACFGLADAGIATIGGLHDAVLIEVPLLNYQKRIAEAESIMQLASASVLHGIPLRTKVEHIYFPAQHPYVINQNQQESS